MKTILSVLLVLTIAPGGAPEFHVAPNGSDANPGTVDRPFCTLQRARDAARENKGSTVRLAPGTYRLNQTVFLEPDLRNVGIGGFEPIPFDRIGLQKINAIEGRIDKSQA